MNKEILFYLIYSLIIILIVNNSFSKNNLEKMTEISNDVNIEINNKVDTMLAEDKNNFHILNSKINSSDNSITIPSLNISNNLNYLPLYSVIPFYNSDDIPEGWFICDGSIYKMPDETLFQTPDLNKRFILGSGNNYEMGDSGGEENVILDATNSGHSHNIEKSSHRHYYDDAISTTNSETGLRAQTDRSNTGSLSTRYGRILYKNLNTQNSSHSHTLSEVGGDQPHDNLPPYINIKYIIRLPTNSTKHVLNYPVNHSPTSWR